MIQQQLIEHCEKEIARNADRDTYGKRLDILSISFFSDFFKVKQ